MFWKMLGFNHITDDNGNIKQVPRNNMGFTFVGEPKVVISEMIAEAARMQKEHDTAIADGVNKRLMIDKFGTDETPVAK